MTNQNDYEQTKEQIVRKEAYEIANAVKSPEQLQAAFDKILDLPSGYGEVVVQLSALMIATFRAYDARMGGITGFQAGFIGWEMVKEFLSVKNGEPCKLMPASKMLYPQYESAYKEISADTFKYLQEEARRLIAKDSEYADPKVFDHWVSIVEGKPPFGLTVTKQ